MLLLNWKQLNQKQMRTQLGENRNIRFYDYRIILIILIILLILCINNVLIILLITVLIILLIHLY